MAKTVLTLPEDNHGNQVVLLTVDENNKVQNVFVTIGMAIDSIGYNANRLDPNCIEKRSLTKLEWHGRDGQKHSLEIKKCSPCTDVSLDYMDRPRALAL